MNTEQMQARMEMIGGRIVATGRVGVPQPGEQVCARCKGAGLLGRRVSSYPGYAICSSCQGSGVVPEPSALEKMDRTTLNGEQANG